MEELLHRHAGELRRVVLRRPVELTGEDRSRQPVVGTAVHDPKRRFSTINCRAAKGSFEHFVGGQLHQIWTGNAEKLPAQANYRAAI